ncbi:hypothetical protein HUU61_00730 [Rhodopseudomonas palustris]|nr:hypothetical protein [Rhodopseudomonas palustris]
MTTPRTETYERSNGPLHLWKPQRRYSRRTVTIPDGVSPHVKLVFSEMSRQGRRYQDIETASGVQRPTVKAWRAKNEPSLPSVTAVLNVLGFDLIPVPAAEVIPTGAAADLAALSSKLGKDMTETWSAVVSFAAAQHLAREAAAQKLATIDAGTAH